MATRGWCDGSLAGCRGSGRIASPPRPISIQCIFLPCNIIQENRSNSQVELKCVLSPRTVANCQAQPRKVQPANLSAHINQSLDALLPAKDGAAVLPSMTRYSSVLCTPYEMSWFVQHGRHVAVDRLLRSIPMTSRSAFC